MNSYTLNHLKKSISEHSATFLATLFSMSVVLSCLSLLLLARQNLISMAEKWGQDSEITAYIDDDLDQKSQLNLKEKIESLEGVEAASYVSKSEAAKKFLARMGHLSPNFLQSDKADENPLPATFDIKMRADISLGDRLGVLKATSEKISSYVGVTEVTFGQGWMETWGKFIQKFNFATLASIGFVLVLGLLIIGNATRVSMERRLEEIEVLELVGATRAWIRKPFLIEGALLGLASAVLSLFISSFLNRAVLGYFSDAGWIWMSDSSLELSWLSALVILLTGLFFGLLGSYFCVRKINSQESVKGNDIYA
ncbi:MAG: FtsX-like permease family protein [Bdellovibrionales bacterium]|nr:FtsX-like permease family protein [Bdellovibrionales bacterium]